MGGPVGGTSPTRHPAGFAGGLIVGLVVGVIGGVLLAQASPSNVTVGAPIAPVSATTAAAPAATTLGGLKINLGRPREESDYLIFPLTIENNTGSDLRYAEADCAFYSKDNTLLAHAMTNMTNLAAGATGSNDLMVQGVTYSEVDHYQCRATS